MSGVSTTDDLRHRRPADLKKKESDEQRDVPGDEARTPRSDEEEEEDVDKVEQRYISNCFVIQANLAI